MDRPYRRRCIACQRCCSEGRERQWVLRLPRIVLRVQGESPKQDVWSVLRDEPVRIGEDFVSDRS